MHRVHPLIIKYNNPEKQNHITVRVNPTFVSKTHNSISIVKLCNTM